MNLPLRPVLRLPIPPIAAVMLIFLVWLVGLAVMTAPHVYAAERRNDRAPSGNRLALVIGNDNYQNVTSLSNARADARAIASALRDDGFNVTLKLDLTDKAMKEAVRTFKSQVHGGDEAIFYFSGHGVQLAQANYLLPTDIVGESEDQVRDEALPLQRVLEDLAEQHARFTLAIIDACRNNPFKSAGKAIGTRGLAPTTAATGQMVIYSAGSGQEALDRLSNTDRDPNGLFTRIFLQEMKQGGLPVVDVLENVRERVVDLAQQVNHEQVPAIYNQSVGKFYFRRVSLDALPDPGSNSEDIETEAWNNIEDSRDEKDFEDYLNTYPNGKHALLARQKKKNLTVVAAPVVAPLAIAAVPAAPPAPSGIIKDCSNCPEMVVIPSGSFMMGSPASEAGRFDNEGPQHPVSGRSYALGKTHVTRGQYAAFVTDTGYQSGTSCVTWNGTKFQDTPDRTWKNPGFAQRDDEPVVCVSWEDTQAYVRWLSGKTGQTYRLPSEAEWEYAARAGTTTSRYWGDNPDDACTYANVVDRSAQTQIAGASGWTVHHCDDGHAYTAPVASYRANRFGLYDMLGNAWEWTQDCWNESYSGAPSDGSAWLSGNCGTRVLRGGSWFYAPQRVRSAFRSWDDPGVRVSISGFRVARTLN